MIWPSYSIQLIIRLSSWLCTFWWNWLILLFWIWMLNEAYWILIRVIPILNSQNNSTVDLVRLIIYKDYGLWFIFQLLKNVIVLHGNMTWWKVNWSVQFGSNHIVLYGSYRLRHRRSSRSSCTVKAWVEVDQQKNSFSRSANKWPFYIY